jgi:hypothetical protein
VFGNRKEVTRRAVVRELAPALWKNPLEEQPGRLIALIANGKDMQARAPVRRGEDGPSGDIFSSPNAEHIARVGDCGAAVTPERCPSSTWLGWGLRLKHKPARRKGRNRFPKQTE